MRTRSCGAISLLLAATGCTPDPGYVRYARTTGPLRTSSVAADYELDPSRDVGLVVVSTLFVDYCGGRSNNSVEVLEAGSRKAVDTLLLANPVVPVDFPDPPGYFFVRELPAGRYELGNMSKDLGKSGYRTDEALGLTFTVERGQVRYLGQVLVTIKSCALVETRVSDQHERDAQLFDERMSKLTSRQWTYAPLQLPVRTQTTRPPTPSF